MQVEGWFFFYIFGVIVPHGSLVALLTPLSELLYLTLQGPLGPRGSTAPYFACEETKTGWCSLKPLLSANVRSTRCIYFNFTLLEFMVSIDSM